MSSFTIKHAMNIVNLIETFTMSTINSNKNAAVIKSFFSTEQRETSIIISKNKCTMENKENMVRGSLKAFFENIIIIEYKIKYTIENNKVIEVKTMFLALDCLLGYK